MNKVPMQICTAIHCSLRNPRIDQLVQCAIRPGGVMNRIIPVKARIVNDRAVTTEVKALQLKFVLFLDIFWPYKVQFFLIQANIPGNWGVFIE